MAADAAPILTTRALNRALLARQMLLERVAMPAEAAIETLIGLQSQIPGNPYTALWSRLEGFRPEEVSDLTAARKLVRIALMRGTLHLVTVADAVALRPIVQKVFERTMTQAAPMAALWPVSTWRNWWRPANGFSRKSHAPTRSWRPNLLRSFQASMAMRCRMRCGRCCRWCR